ncbi:MAG: hypothetical protein IIA75_11440, partial [Proteobacteria bacterium]|nr:hypothetical protein [Pseudomonadota bacterium]
KVDGNATTGEVAFVTAVGVLRAAFLGKERRFAADDALAYHLGRNGEIVAVTFQDVATNATRRGAADAARDIARTGGVNADTLTALGALFLFCCFSSWQIHRQKTIRQLRIYSNGAVTLISRTRQ